MKYRCLICGHIYDEEKEGVKFADLPADWKCPTCKQPKEKFVPVEDEMTWAAEHVVGVAKDVDEDIKNDLRANFEGECSEVGMYLAMARVAHREGYPEVGLYYEKAAWEEAEHAARFCEMNGIIKDDLKANIEMMLEGEKMANAEKREASEKAAAENLEDATDFFKESSKDEGRHYKILEGILERYF